VPGEWRAVTLLISPRLTTCICPSDVDGDGIVGFSDLIAVLSSLGQHNVSSDVNGDGIVDFSDLVGVLADWGPCEE